MCRCCLFLCVYVCVWRNSKTKPEQTPELAIQAAAGTLAVRTAIRTQPALGAEGARILLAGATLRPPQHVQMVRSSKFIGAKIIRRSATLNQY